MICICGLPHHDDAHKVNWWKVNVNGSKNGVLVQMEDDGSAGGSYVRAVLREDQAEELIAHLRRAVAVLKKERAK